MILKKIRIVGIFERKVGQKWDLGGVRINIPSLLNWMGCSQVFCFCNIFINILLYMSNCVSVYVCVCVCVCWKTGLRVCKAGTSTT
jgi:hypothetical protein